jgi:hypothetical protein
LGTVANNHCIVYPGTYNSVPSTNFQIDISLSNITVYPEYNQQYPNDPAKAELYATVSLRTDATSNIIMGYYNTVHTGFCFTVRRV